MGSFSFFTTAELRAVGETKQSIRDSIEHGARFRVIKGWYGTEATPAEAVLAMRMGGRIGCVSALHLYGAWSPPDCGVHVFFPTSASGRRSAGRDRGSRVVRHWHGRDIRSGSAFAVPPVEVALRDALDCQPPFMLIAILDSLLHRGLMSRNRLEAIVRRGPGRNHHLIAHLDPRSESGIESILRYRLAIAGIATSIQVRMRSSDRLDVEIDGWLALEADGREFHAQARAFTRDRARVVRVMREGRIVLQFSYAAIMYGWQEVFDAIVAVMAQHAPAAV